MHAGASPSCKVARQKGYNSRCYNPHLQEEECSDDGEKQINQNTVTDAPGSSMEAEEPKEDQPQAEGSNHSTHHDENNIQIVQEPRKSPPKVISAEPNAGPQVNSSLLELLSDDELKFIQVVGKGKNVVSKEKNYVLSNLNISPRGPRNCTIDDILALQRDLKIRIITMNLMRTRLSLYLRIIN